MAGRAMGYTRGVRRHSFPRQCGRVVSRIEKRSDREWRVVEAHLEPVLGQVEKDCWRHISSLSASELDTAETGAKIGIEFITLPF